MGGESAPPVAEGGKSRTSAISWRERNPAFDRREQTRRANLQTDALPPVGGKRTLHDVRFLLLTLRRKNRHFAATSFQVAPSLDGAGKVSSHALAPQQGGPLCIVLHSRTACRGVWCLVVRSDHRHAGARKSRSRFRPA